MKSIGLGLFWGGISLLLLIAENLIANNADPDVRSWFTLAICGILMTSGSILTLKEKK